MSNDSEKGNLIGSIRKAQQLNYKLGDEIDRIWDWIIEPDYRCPMPPRRIAAPAISASCLTISTEVDGSASVVVDNGKPFRLPPVLATLFETLAMDEESTGSDNPRDPFVPWKPFELIMSRMRVRQGFSEGALRQAIHRLRKVLAVNNLDGLLCKHRHMRAYRIAITRQISQ